MRRRLSAIAAVVALALTLAVGGSATAQEEQATEVVGEAQDAVDTATGAVDDDGDGDSGRWGLLGLLGLGGLAGLLKKPQRTVVDQTRTVVEPVTQRVTDATTNRR